MGAKSFFAGILGGILGIVIILGGAGIIDYILTSRQKIEPGESAIIREVWKKEGPLIGPSSPPYNVRVVENNSSEPLTFIIQPFPFGCVEEILKKEKVRDFSFNLPLWTKDSITSDPDDSSIVRILSASGNFKVKNVNLYAQNLDHLELPYAKQGDLLYPLKNFLMQRGVDLEIGDRQRLFSELMYFDFSKFFSTKVEEWGKSVAQKYTILAKSIQEKNITSSEEKERFINEFLEKYPWYKLEQDYFNKLRENKEVQTLFQKYLEALSSKNEELAISSLKEIQKFFKRYIEENPQAYDKEKWEYVKSILLKEENPPSEYKPEMMYPFIEKNIQQIKNMYLEEEKENILHTYGIELINMQVKIKDDLTARYPFILSRFQE